MMFHTSSMCFCVSQGGKVTFYSISHLCRACWCQDVLPFHTFVRFTILPGLNIESKGPFGTAKRVSTRRGGRIREVVALERVF